MAEYDDYMTRDEERAVRRVERAIKALPRTVALYFHGEAASVIRCDEDGLIPTGSDGVSIPQEASVGGIATPRCAAGDF